MIKAHELRIRNLLNYHAADGDILPTRIDWQDFQWIDENEKGFNLFHSPIPITEELLIMAGFKVLESSVYKQFYIGINPVTKDWLFDLAWLEKPELIGAPNVPFYRNGYHAIHFVHQLQNLYFALTGEELIFEGLN